MGLWDVYHPVTLHAQSSPLQILGSASSWSNSCEVRVCDFLSSSFSDARLASSARSITLIAAWVNSSNVIRERLSAIRLTPPAYRSVFAAGESVAGKIASALPEFQPWPCAALPLKLTAWKENGSWREAESAIQTDSRGLKCVSWLSHADIAGAMPFSCHVGERS